MKREGHLTLTLRAGVAAAAVPSHLDCLSGACRPSAVLDGGHIDAVVRSRGGGARIQQAFHARRSLGRTGEQHVGFDDREEALGLSRCYQVRLAQPQAAEAVREALRDLASVEQCDVQTLAWSPLDAAPVAAMAPVMGTARQTNEPGATRHARRITRERMIEPLRRIRAAEALAQELGSAAVTVAVIDTGIVVGHPEFQRRCLAGYDTVDLGIGRLNDSTELVGDSRGWDYNPYDEVGHGCLVAGIIGARGFRVPAGLAGLAMLLPIRVLAAARRGSGHAARVLGVGALPDIDAGLKVAVDLGASIINMSLGSPLPADDPHAALPHRAVVRYAVERGCVLVAAAGNSGRRERFYPAALPDVIAVGSVDSSGTRSAFSSYGEHVALCAPGENIVGVGRRGYQASSGTSFAAPFVAGTAALLAARARSRGHALGAALARRVLCDSARRLPGGPSEETGVGLLDCAAALQMLDRLTPSASRQPFQ